MSFLIHAPADPTIGTLRLLRPCSGYTREGSPSAQVKAAVAHVERLKWKPAKKKVKSGLCGIYPQLKIYGL
jgi:hypothetical protein